MKHIKTVQVSVEELNLYHRNPRLGNVEAIAESLKANGQYRAIVVNKGTHTNRPMEVLAGNHTLKAARQLEWETVLAHVIDVDEDAATRIVLVDNRASDLATMDYDVLLGLTANLEDLTGTGYTEDDLAMFEPFEPEELLAGDDDLPEASDIELRTSDGDIWQLGDHLLAVGSAEDPEVWGSLMGGDKADVIWTDPPYGVDYEGKTKEQLTIENDSVDGLKELLDSSFPLMLKHARDGCPIYVAHPDIHRNLFETSFINAGFLFRQNLIWVKNTIVMGRKDYHWQHETIMYGFKPAPAGSGKLGRGGSRWYGDDSQSTVLEAAQAIDVARVTGDDGDLFYIDPFRLEDALKEVSQQTTVLQHDKPAASRLHPTMKPVGLVIDTLLNSAKRGDIVVDPFVGSGSTLIATEKLGLRARVIELEPRYADVVLERWEEATAGKAVKVGVVGE